MKKCVDVRFHRFISFAYLRILRRWFSSRLSRLTPHSESRCPWSETEQLSSEIPSMYHHVSGVELCEKFKRKVDTSECLYEISCEILFLLSTSRGALMTLLS